MRSITRFLGALAIALTAFALISCGGTSAPAPTPAPPPVVVKSAIPAATYVAKPKAAAMVLATTGADSLTPVGTMPQTLIVENGGVFTMELDGFNYAYGALFTDPSGNLSVSSDSTLVHQDGTNEPFTLTGTNDGTTLSGTSNGGAFSLTLSTIQDTPIDIQALVGNYLSTVSSNGQTIIITLTTDPTQSNLLQITGEAYASPEDAAAKVNRLGTYWGSLSYSDADPTHQRNCFLIGFIYNQLPGGTSGLAYIDASGHIVALSANPHNSNPGSGQLTAIFTKQ